MDPLKQKFFEKASALKEQVKTMLKEHGETVVGEVTLSQVYGGARDIKMMVWETSELDAQEGIRFRGYSIPELKKLLPKGDKEPRPEGLFWLMLTDEIPTAEEVNWLTEEWKKRSVVPAYVFAVLDTLPADDAVCCGDQYPSNGEHFCKTIRGRNVKSGSLGCYL